MHIYPYKAESYLREARESLKRMNTAKNADELNRAFISFLNASRLCTQHLETEYGNKVPGFNEWWEQKGIYLAQDTLASFFVRLRNNVLKSKLEPFTISWEIGGPLELKGPLQIAPDGTVYKIDRRGKTVKQTPMEDVQGQKILSWDFKQKPKGYENLSAYMLCQQYLELLEGIMEDFTDKFISLKKDSS